MSFWNSGNNNAKKEKPNINTNAFQLYNKNGTYQSTLICGFWNEMVSLKIHPAKPKSEQTESQIYDYEKFISTVLNVDRASIFIKCVEYVIKALKEDEETSAGVVIGGDNLLEIGSFRDNQSNLKGYLAIYKKLTEEVKPQEYCFYEFNTNQMIREYNKDTGKYENELIHNEIDLFYTFMTKAVSALTNAEVHVNANHYRTQKQYEQMKAIMSHLGLETPKSSNRSSFGPNRFDSNGLNSETNLDNNVDKIDSLDEIPF